MAEERNFSKNNLSIRQFTSEDLPTLHKWGDQWNWGNIPLSHIPKNSFFVLRDGKEVAFSGFASTDCGIAIMGFTVSDRTVKDSEAVDFLVEFLLKKAKEFGYEFFHYYTNSKPMCDRMEKQGLTVTSRNNAYILMGAL